MQVLEAAEIDSSVVSLISSSFSQDLFRDPFHDLDTGYKQLEFYKEHLNLIVSYFIPLQCEHNYYNY